MFRVPFPKNPLLRKLSEEFKKKQVLSNSSSAALPDASSTDAAVTEITATQVAEVLQSEEPNPNLLLADKMLGLHRLIVTLLGVARLDENQRLNIAASCHEIKNLIARGANPNLRTQSQFAPLHLAAFTGNLDLLQFLSKRSDVDFAAVDFDGQTALHIAVSQSRMLPTLMLLQALKNSSLTHEEFVAKINQKNRERFSAINYAKFPALFSILVNYGADSGFSKADLQDIEATKKIIAAVDRTGDETLVTKFSYLEYMKFYTSLSPVQQIIRRFIGVVDVLDSANIHGVLEKEILEGLVENLTRDLEEIATTSEVATEIFDKLLETAVTVKNSASQFFVTNLSAQGDFEGWWLKARSPVAFMLNACVRMSDLMEGYAEEQVAIFEKLSLWVTNSEAVRTEIELLSSNFCTAVLESKKKSASLKKAAVPAKTEAISIQAKKVEMPVEAIPVVEKTPAEKLRDLLFSLQKSAARGEKERYPEENRQNLLYLFDRSGESMNTRTTKDWTALHIASRLGNAELVSELISCGANVNAKTQEGFSALYLASLSNNREVFGKILSVVELDLALIGDDLKEIFKSKNKSVVADFFASQALAQKVADLDVKARTNLLLNWRSLNKQNSGNVVEDFKKKISQFEFVVNSLIEASKAVEIEESVFEEAPKISKKERERVRKEQNRIKREEEERVRLELQQKKELERKIREEERIRLAEERREEEERIRREEEERIRFEGEAKIPAETSLISVQDVDVNQIVSDSDVELVSEQQQMINFFHGSHQINSVADLPEFLQPKIRKFLAENCLVCLKGSAVWGKGLTGRAPSDLDLELSVQGIATWPDEEIVNFVQENFAVEVSPQQIYRGPNRDGSVFTLNFKDEERLLDISIYDKDPQFLPPLSLGWTNNKESKIFFNPSGNARLIRSIEIEKRIADLRFKGFNFNDENDLLINPQARGLLMRLCFLQTAGLFTKPELAKSLWQVFPKNPVDLLFKELKLDQPESFSNQEKWIEEKISDFAKSHNLNHEQKADFLQNLNYAIYQQVNPDFDSRLRPDYQILYKTLAPSQNPEAPFAVTLAQKSRVKT